MLRRLGADVPKCSAGGAVAAEVGSATGFPHAAADTEIDISEHVVVGRALVMAKTKVGSRAGGSDAARTAFYGNIVDESLVDLKAREQVVIP